MNESEVEGDFHAEDRGPPSLCFQAFPPVYMCYVTHARTMLLSLMRSR